MKQCIVSFLVSGRGSNFKTVAEQILAGTISAKPGVVISDKPAAAALDTARSMGIAAEVVDPRNFSTREEHEKAMIKILKQYDTDLVVTAGYMRILTSYFVKAYRHAIINIHPALLPSFPGVNAQKQALDYGTKVTGCTAHFVDEGTDTGPIILQRIVYIRQRDTVQELSSRILTEEHKALPDAVKLFCEGRLKVIGRSVYISD